MSLDKEIVRKIDDIERLAYEIAAATRKVRHMEEPCAKEITVEGIAEEMARDIFPLPTGTITSNKIACHYTDAEKIKTNIIRADRIPKVPLDVKSYPLKYGLEREKEPDAVIQDEYQKEGHTVLEMRFPDNEAGWEHWRKLVETVRRFETGFSALIEEIEPGKLKAVIHLK